MVFAFSAFLNGYSSIILRQFAFAIYTLLPGKKITRHWQVMPMLLMSSKVRITQILDAPELVGKYVYVFARWKNNSDDTKSGPWSLMAFAMIS